MNYKELLVDASKQLKFYKFNSATLDTELILSKTLGISREKILLNLNEKINDNENEKKTENDVDFAHQKQKDPIPKVQKHVRMVHVFPDVGKNMYAQYLFSMYTF